MKVISKATYPEAAYTHQGWVTDPNNQEYLLVNDELDEQRGKVPGGKQQPTTYVWDIKNLEAPKRTGYFQGAVASTDHNMYVWNGFLYQSNYASGFRVLDITSIPMDPSGKSVKEVGFFDIYPEDDARPTAQMIGTWSSYARFPSGFIYINTMSRGGFVVKIKDTTLRR